MTLLISTLTLDVVKGLDLSEEQRTTAGLKLKTVLSDFFNDNVLKWARDHYQLQDKYIPKALRFVRLTNVTVGALDGMATASADFQFDVDKILNVKTELKKTLTNERPFA